MKIIKCDEILHDSSEIGFRLVTGEIYYVLESNLRLKDADHFIIGKEYRILQYKISKDPTGNRILIGHSEGHHDWVVSGFMESFIRDQEYYLKGLYLEEIKV